MATEEQRAQWRERWERSLKADKDLAEYMRRRKQYGDGEQQKGRKA